VAHHELCLASRAKRIYANAHTYHINSISVNSDQQTFLSADDLRINLWHLDVVDQSFNIVDIKPPNMDDLTEVCARVCVWGGPARRSTLRTCALFMRCPVTTS
jgi:serine/threonine-protein phosphatase 2A regulatory subunit B